MTMVQEFSCKNAGAPECPFMLRDQDTDELVRVVQQHASRFHNEALGKDDVLKNTKNV
jgi:predicted small metal-binding protein